MLDSMMIGLLLSATALIVWLSMNNHSLWSAHWPDYGHMVSSLPEPTAWLRWVLGDISEVAFYKHEFASIGLLAGAYLVFALMRSIYRRNVRRPKREGFKKYQRMKE